MIRLSRPCSTDNTSKPLWDHSSSCYMSHIYSKYLERQAWANSVDPDQMPQNVASDLGLYCLTLIKQFLDTLTGIKWSCSTSTIRSFSVWIFGINTVMLAIPSPCSYPWFKSRLTNGVAYTFFVLTVFTDGVLGLEGWLKLRFISLCLFIYGEAGFLKILGVDELVYWVTEQCVPIFSPAVVLLLIC